MLNRVIDNMVRPGETVELVVREYGITQLPKTLLLTVMYIGVFFLFYPLVAAGSWGVVVFLALLVGTVWWGVRTAVVWYLDVLLITDQRLIDIHQRGVFSQTVHEIAYTAITDVVYSKRGVWATLLNYGTLTITLNGGGEQLDLDHVYDPKTVREFISEYAEYQEEFNNQSDQTVINRSQDAEDESE